MHDSGWQNPTHDCGAYRRNIWPATATEWTRSTQRKYWFVEIDSAVEFASWSRRLEHQQTHAQSGGQLDQHPSTDWKLHWLGAVSQALPCDKCDNWTPSNSRVQWSPLERARCGEGTLLFKMIITRPVDFHDTSIANTGRRSLLAFTAILMQSRPVLQKSAANMPTGTSPWGKQNQKWQKKMTTTVRQSQARVGFWIRVRSDLGLGPELGLGARIRFRVRVRVRVRAKDTVRIRV